MPRLTSNRPLDRLDTALIRAGIRRTPQLVKVFQALKHGGPLTIRQLADQLMATVAERTVYNHVHRLVGLGVIRRLVSGRYELRPPYVQKHFTLVCQDCRRRYTYYDGPIEAAIKRWAQRHTMPVAGWQLEIEGRCGLCRQHGERELAGAGAGEFNQNHPLPSAQHEPALFDWQRN